MSVLTQKLASEIFEILKSYGKTLILYDDSGNVTYDPEQATRMFISPEKMMLSISFDGDDNEVKLYLSHSVILADQMKLINTLRQTATRLNSLFNVRKYGKELSPKDFAYQVTSEGLHEAYWGTAKTSYCNVGNCKLIFHHNVPVNEEKRGSRSRNIKNIYIENSNKEKSLLPSNNIHAARALARHISSGGKIYDRVGDYIVECSKEYDILKKSLRYVKECITDDYLKNTIVQSIKERIYDINRTFDIIRGSRNYKKYNTFFSNKSLYEFTTYDNDLENNIKNNVTTSELDIALPYIISCMSVKKSLLPSIEISDDNIINIISILYKRKFKYGIDYVIKNNTIIFYNPNFLTEMIYYLDKQKIKYIFNNNDEIDNIHITNNIEVSDVRNVTNILNTELGLELGADYVVDNNIIGFLSSDIYAEVVNFLNTTNINYIELSEDSYNDKDDLKMSDSSTDKIYKFSKDWIEKNTDSSVGFSSEDSVHDRNDINKKAESLSNELKTFMKSSTISGIDNRDRTFNNKRAEQAYKISATAAAGGLDGDMLFNFLTNISEKIRNNQNLDNNEKAVAKKAIDMYDNSSEDLKENENPDDYHNIVSISWNYEIPEKLHSILENIPFGSRLVSEGNLKKGYINYEIYPGKDELFNRSVTKYLLNYNCDNIVKVSGTKEVKKPMTSKPSKWKQFLGFKEEKQIEEWFSQFNPENQISEQEETEEDFIINPSENDDELLLSAEDDPDIEISISESIFSDAKSEDKLCSDIEDIKDGRKLSFAYIDDAGKFVIYDEVTNTPIKEYSDEDVADKICDLYNGAKYEQAKQLVLTSLENTLDEIRKVNDEESLNEQEIREKSINKKINDYAITQYSPSYEIDVNRTFGLERPVSIAEQFSFITTISEQLYKLSKNNSSFDKFSYTPYIFESSAVDIFNNDVKPRLKECGFIFVSGEDEDDDYGFEREPTENDIIRATRAYNEIINGDDIDIDLSEGELDDVINDSSKDFNIDEYYDKSYLDKFKKGELPVHILDSKIAKALYHNAEIKGLLDKVSFTLSPENFMGRASQIASDYINGIREDDNQSPIDVARRMGYDAARSGDKDKFDSNLRSLMNDHPGDKQREDIHKAYIAGMDDFKSKEVDEGKDLGKPGKNFDKIAKSAGKEYGSKEAGERVAGAVLSKLRKEHPEEYKESVNNVENMSNFISKLNSIFDNKSMFEADDESPYDIARRMGYNAAKKGQTDTFNPELHSMLDDQPGSKHNKQIHSAFMQGMSDYENEHKMSEDLEDETLGNPDVTIPTNVQDTFKNDVSSDIMDNPDMDLINDIRRRAGLI
ncbi:MAG: hypothetical protein [Caudoviricetes sp.]|nr:MAG: hypothetical protein [Caudoviricetes sp.]